ncbi:MAG: hypothetical protein EON51_02070 [Acinetobacter sp.]|nr:MAG: hypothetical protein EON51_02070 [Acinetobacter sp.]
MNENNLEFLQNNLKYLGFGDKLNGTLKDSINLGVEKFTLHTSSLIPFSNQRDDPNKGTNISYEINFSKAKEADMYFLNNYRAEIKSGEKAGIAQTFYVNKGKGVTAKEAFNLLSGRAVNKDIILKSGEQANVWMKLDFAEAKEKNNYLVKSFGEKYGFDLSKSLENSTIKGLENPEIKEKLIKSLEKGNQHEVTFQKNGLEASGFVTANPQFKTLDYSDIDLKPIFSKAIGVKNVVEQKEVETTQDINVKAMEKAIAKAVKAGVITQVDISEGNGHFEMNGKKFPDIIQIMNDLKTPSAVNKMISDFEKTSVSNDLNKEPTKSRGR